MTRKELTQNLRLILGRNDITIRERGAKTQIGEIHGNFVAIYGNYSFEAEGMNAPYMINVTNESLWYADERDRLIQALTDAGLNVLSAPGGKHEILVEVSRYYYGNSEEKYYDYRHYFLEEQFGRSYKYAHYKMVNI